VLLKRHLPFWLVLLIKLAFKQGCAVGVGVARSRRFLVEPQSDFFVQLDNFLHQTPKLEIPVEMVQFLFKLLLKQGILAVHHDFH